MNKLRLYYWLGVQHSGQKTTGRTLAYSSEQLGRVLQLKEIRLLKFVPKPVPSLMSVKHSVRTLHITVFTQQLALMLDSGLPIAVAMTQLQQGNPRQGITALMEEISFQVQQGKSLSSVMHDFTYFDPLYLQFVRVGEANGDLAKALNFCAQHREKNSKLLKQVKSAMIYPVSVIIIAGIVMAVMLIFVIPQFSSLFSSFGANLPAITQFTLDASLLLQRYAGHILLTIVAVVAAFRLALKSASFRYQVSRKVLATPILGSCILSGELARFNLLLSNGIQAGLPLVLCLDNATAAVNNTYLKTQLAHINPQIRQGSTLYSALKRISCIPSLMLKMLSIGEVTGTLAIITDKLATQFELEVDEATEKLGQCIEPIMIVFLGLLVGGLVLSMYLPIFTLMSEVG
ncbi:type II secretion system F family protein [Vibrio rarus]|uniref:type II secretion system F family protein n=1 Tax=Vibrio rarus TaxID=413403 RepID=UPI0021C2DC52|nr:type II secretion system F family protein [Vibrio rarus]